MNGNAIARLRDALGIGQQSERIGTILAYDPGTQTARISVGGKQMMSKDSRVWAPGARAIVGAGGSIIGPVPEAGITVWID